MWAFGDVAFARKYADNAIIIARCTAHTLHPQHLPFTYFSDRAYMNLWCGQIIILCAFLFSIINLSPFIYFSSLYLPFFYIFVLLLLLLPHYSPVAFVAYQIQNVWYLCLWLISLLLLACIAHNQNNQTLQHFRLRRFACLSRLFSLVAYLLDI